MTHSRDSTRRTEAELPRRRFLVTTAAGLAGVALGGAGSLLQGCGNTAVGCRADYVPGAGDVKSLVSDTRAVDGFRYKTAVEGGAAFALAHPPLGIEILSEDFDFIVQGGVGTVETLYDQVKARGSDHSDHLESLHQYSALYYYDDKPTTEQQFGPGDAVRLTVYVTDMNRHRPIVNKVQAELWSGGPYPPRTILEVSDLAAGDIFEVEGTFYAPIKGVN